MTDYIAMARELGIQISEDHAVSRGLTITTNGADRDLLIALCKRVRDETLEEAAVYIEGHIPSVNAAMPGLNLVKLPQGVDMGYSQTLYAEGVRALKDKESA